MSGRVLIRNLGAIASGDIGAPRAEGDSILFDETGILKVGQGLADPSAEIVDARGALAVPGLVDAHAHPVIGDFTPRQGAQGWTGRALHGGVTSLISAGETHWPNRTKDGKEAVAICAAAFLTSRKRQSACARVHGGALLLDSGIEEQDILGLHKLGVRKLGEIGLGSEKDVTRIAELVAYARKLGWVAPLHFGGASVPGSSVVSSDIAHAVSPSVISHANGGPTARPLAEIRDVIDGTDAAIEIVHAGNTRAMIAIVERLLERGELHRLQYGTDTPSGTGVVPLGMLRLVTESVALAGADPFAALALATGSAATRYGLTTADAPDSTLGARPLGMIRAGWAADLVLLADPLGSERGSAEKSLAAGNTPAVARVYVDGAVEVTKSGTTPPPVEAIA